MMSAILMVAAVSCTQYDLAAFEMVKDAQITSSRKSHHGETLFKVKWSVAGRRPVEVEGAFSWFGEDAAWVFRMSDPEHLVTASGTRVETMADAVVDRMVLKGDTLYSYDGKSNVLHITEVKDRPILITNYFLLNLFPADLWDRCYAPHHGGGILWYDMMHAGSRASSANSIHSFTQSGRGQFSYSRSDPKIGKVSIECSLANEGRPSSYIYEAEKGIYPSIHVKLDWKQDKGVVLSKYEMLRTAKNDSRTIEESFRVELTNTKIGATSSATQPSFEDMKIRLPKTTSVNNHKMKRTYRLFEPPSIGNDAIDELTKKMKASGFANPEKQK